MAKKKLSKKQIKKHNELQDLKKELSLVTMAANFVKQYIDQYPDHIQAESYHIARVVFTYRKYLDEVLDLSDKMFKEVEKEQRSAKPARFKAICKFDEEGFLAVSIISLVINLLDIHKNIRNRKVVLDNSLYKIKDYHKNMDEVRNAKIVASKFFDKIDSYYESKKIKEQHDKRVKESNVR